MFLFTMRRMSPEATFNIGEVAGDGSLPNFQKEQVVQIVPRRDPGNGKRGKYNRGELAQGTQSRSHFFVQSLGHSYY